MVEGCQNFPGSCKRYLADSVFGTVLLTIKQILVYVYVRRDVNS